MRPFTTAALAVLSLTVAACGGFDPCAPEAQALNLVAPGVGVALASQCAAQGDKVGVNADLDGDGVPDPHDVCPQTPAGAAPDPARSGCPLPKTAALTFEPRALEDGFTNINGVSWRSSAAWDARVNGPAVATLGFRAPLDPGLQHALQLQLAASADLTTSANIVDCAPPAQDYVLGRCVRRDLQLQVLAGGLTLYDAALSTSAADWQPALPTIVLPVGASEVLVKFSAVGTVLVTPRLVAGSGIASAVR